jgi:DNA-binding NarL/FixJ family response regulator
MISHPIKSSYALVIDDHPLYANGIAALLTAHHLVQSTQTATTEEGCNEVIEKLGLPAIVVADFWLKSGAAVNLITNIKEANGLERILIVSADTDPAVALRAMSLANGFVHKQAPPDEFIQAVRHILSGGTWFVRDDTRHEEHASLREIPITASELGLSARQAQILHLVLEGQPNKRIALTLSLSESTIKEHVTGILHKLGVSNRVEAIAKMRGYRLVSE